MPGSRSGTPSPTSANSATARLRWSIEAAGRPASWSMSARWFSTAASRWRSPIRRQASMAAAGDRHGVVHRARRGQRRSASAVSPRSTAVGSGSSAAMATLRSSAARAAAGRRAPGRRARPVARRRPAQTRVADVGRQVAGLARPSTRLIQVAGSERDDAALDQRARPRAHGSRSGEARADVEVAGGRGEVAAPTMDPAERDLDGGQVGRVGEGGGRLEGRDARPGTRRAATAARRSGRGRAAAVRSAQGDAPPRGARSPRGWRRRLGPVAPPRGRPRPPRPAGRPRARGRRSGRTGRGRRDRRPIGSSRSASAVRRWSSRRRARLVAS